MVEPLLPIARLEPAEAESAVPDYLYEPTQQELFETLLPRHVTFQVFRALLEVGGRGAWRAHDGHGEGHQQRRRDDRPPHPLREPGAAGRITKEIIEVVSGAQALG